MSKATHDIMVSIGEYKDRETGRQKKKYLKIGTQFMSDEGHISQVLNLPPNFKDNRDGYPEAWLKIFPIREQQQAPVAQQQYNGNGYQPQPPAPIQPLQTVARVPEPHDPTSHHVYNQNMQPPAYNGGQ